MSFSYDISVRVNQTLATVSSSLYQLGFCTAGSNVVSPPAIQLALAGSGTAANTALKAKCYDIDTGSAVLIAAASEFGTNAAATYVFLRENSGHAAAELQISDGNPNVIFRMTAGQSALIPALESGQQLYALEAGTNKTASLQVIVIGE
jgi:hypothetical protein